MTRITFYKKDGHFWGFDEIGHSGYADEGEDILCAAISAMTMLVINTAEVAYSCDAECEVDDENARIGFFVREALPEYSKDVKRQFAVSGLLEGFFNQMTDLAKQYGGFIEVTAAEKTPSI